MFTPITFLHYVNRQLDEVDIPMDVVNETARKIKALEIQGATNVAIAAVNALSEQIQLSDEVDRGSILSKIDEAKEILFASRETEPFLSLIHI